MRCHRTTATKHSDKGEGGRQILGTLRNGERNDSPSPRWAADRAGVAVTEQGDPQTALAALSSQGWYSGGWCVFQEHAEYNSTECWRHLLGAQNVPGSREDQTTDKTLPSPGNINGTENVPSEQSYAFAVDRWTAPKVISFMKTYFQFKSQIKNENVGYDSSRRGGPLCRMSAVSSV